MTEKTPKRLTPNEFWLMAASWGSAMTAGDPGSCMYGFDENGLVQSEEHRQNCIEYIETECRRIADADTASDGGGTGQRAGEIQAMLMYLKTAPIEGDAPDLDDFTKSYIEAALWSTNDEGDETGGEPLDRNYGAAHIAPESLRRIISDCAHFQATYGGLLTNENLIHSRGGSSVLGMAAHDFWLTRNGHGAGFWDGDWSERVEDILSKAARSYGEADLYVGDDGRIYQSGGVESPAPIPGALAAEAPSPSP